MARKTHKGRSFDPISLSFLDVISCGFGAVILLFLIMDHSKVSSQESNPELSAEISLLDEDIRTGEAGLVQVRNTLSDVDLQMVEAQGLASVIEEEIESIMEALSEIENESSASDNSVDKLRSDIDALEAELAELRAKEEQETGNNIRRFVGTGNRQYLTGMILGGNRILILVDVSASMLDSTIVNIIRRRNMPDAAKLASEKWVRVRRTVEWLVSQMPVPSQYQIYAFNNETRALLAGTEGQWLEVADQDQLESAMATLDTTIPSAGTNMDAMFSAISNFSPLPDNIYLITDGLPTLDSTGTNQRTVSGREREALFEQAVKKLPEGIPVNIIMAPLEGDPMAASLFWQLAVSSGGSLMNPSTDWP